MDFQLQAIAEARHHHPFDYLGQHPAGQEWIIRAFLPQAAQVEVLTPTGWEPLSRMDAAGLFAIRRPAPLPQPYRLRWQAGGRQFEIYDPYSFPPSISDFELHLFGEGRLWEAYRMLGAHPREQAGVQGVRFAVWAPNAERVSVVGDFNDWDGRRHPMQVHGSSGVWELFIPELPDGTLYKFEIRNRATGAVLVKTDPYGAFFEHRPGTAARVYRSRHQWGDAEWLRQRAAWDWQHAPVNCYEVHLGSWQRGPDGRFLSYGKLAERLIPYAKEMGYTHLELMPVSEHPLDESWGYQVTGYYAPTSRYGEPDDFRAFVDQCHQAGLGVILDWVPGHFPKDDFALARFDGTALYEHEDPRLGEHQDWGTYIFNYGRNEVRNFLLANAHYWLEEFHVDGLRVDAVASMLYLDYSRQPGEWLPNRHGGRENLEAIDFLREMNIFVHERHPGALTIAEESTAWPMVSRPTYVGGLGFSMKWNMGWMNDTLSYMENDPIHRRYHQDMLTFSQVYAYTENFVLPLSHDEVVHGKRSLLDKMPGDAWRKFANLRLLFTYQATHPGKKLNFMGNEFAQGREWQVNSRLDWELLDRQWHAGMQRLSNDLNQLYRQEPALHALDFSADGFRWIDCHDADQSVLAYLRQDQHGDCVIVLLNFTPVPRPGYRVGVPKPGFYREIFNSDSAYYGGSNLGNGGGAAAEAQSWMGFPHSLSLTLPPLAGIVLKPQ
ncbi:MAG: 1,4-alpha-glucan branching protein GlgB [Pseudomonadota bacterium]|uniref:1,4-alpha-glucan branching protein GlgB n=1 Tax=Thermithiobacillus tepidarius TaxID=929 RepID=UPI0004166A6F|nr:1,4-alpha-glucan branching protein GlgB [Thermithiobacillus tepidarius]